MLWASENPCSLLNVKWWWRCVRAGRKTDIYSQEERPASGLSWIWTLAPPCNYRQTIDCALKDERTGPSGLDPPQPLASASPSHCAQTLHIWELCSKGPSDNYTRQHDTRSRRLRRERTEREREGKSVSYFASKVIWSNVWQWAVGLWNVSGIDLHISLYSIWIFWFVRPSWCMWCLWVWTLS